jgi:hypothetical protein
MQRDMDNGQADETAGIAGAEDWREQVIAEHHGEARDEGDMLDRPIAEVQVLEADEPVIRVLAEPFGSAKTLMLAIHHAHEENLPLRGVQLHSDDWPALNTLVEVAYVSRDSIKDILGLTTDGRLFIGLKPEGVLDLPVEVAEVTGNIEESELMARYVEGKIAAIDHAITMGNAPKAEMQVSWEESYQHCALTLRALADEIRMGLHTPSVHIEGRVIYYNEDRSTGVSHAAAITTLCNDVHGRNVQAGWWNDLVTGDKLDRNPGELIALCHSELSECLEGVRKNLMDDKLPHRKMEEVEMADCVIRIADYCGGRGLDLGGAIDEKLAYNATRADHKPENRLKDDGKKI